MNLDPTRCSNCGGTLNPDFLAVDQGRLSWYLCGWECLSRFAQKRGTERIAAGVENPLMRTWVRGSATELRTASLLKQQLGLHRLPDHCPDEPEELAELYCLNRLNPNERSAYEEHLIACSRCVTAIEEAQTFSDTIQEALRRLSTRKI